MITREETVTRTDDDELDKLIKETYGIDYGIVGAEDDISSSNVFEVSAEKFSKYQAKEFEDWKKGNCPYPVLHLILRDLCRLGKIPAGTLLMHAEY